MTDVRSLDLTGTVAPALSTTSDMPVIDAPKETPKGAVSEEELAAGGTEALKAKEKGDESKDEPKADAKEGDGDKPKPDNTPAWQKAEITKARNRQRDADARADAAEARANATNDRLDKALAALEKISTRTGTDVQTPDADPRPVRTAYDDPEKYEADLVAWSAKTAAKVTQAEIEKAAKEREATETKAKTEKVETEKREKVLAAWQKSKTKALETYPDFEEVAESPDVTITPSMVMAMLQINKSKGNGADIAYHLGKHPEEAARIATLDQEDQFVELAEISATLKAKPTPITKVPEPPKPVGSRASATKKSPDAESMEEYAARRNASLRANPH